MPEPTDPIDQRAQAALEALRGDPAPQGAAISQERFDRPSFAIRVRFAAEQRWPGLVEARLGTVLAAVAAIAVLLVVGVWIAVSGTAGPDDGSGGAFSLPFTTTIAPPGPGAGAGAVPGTGSGTTLAAVVVHAAGAVQQPGVHRVPNGARVADVLVAAGGPTPEADVDRLNLAALVSDGQRLYVPRVGESSAPPAVGPEGGTGSGAASGAGGRPASPIDLNQATEAELDVLPGVGPSTAAAIVAHREANGPFRTVDDLLQVRGIGPSKLEAMRDLVRVG